MYSSAFSALDSQPVPELLLIREIVLSVMFQNFTHGLGPKSDTTHTHPAPHRGGWAVKRIKPLYVKLNHVSMVMTKTKVSTIFISQDDPVWECMQTS